MTGKRSIIITVLIVTFWVSMMGLIFRRHYTGERATEVGLSPGDYSFNESARFYGVYIGNKKIGYCIRDTVNFPGGVFLRENLTLKVNLAGKSREVIMNTIATVDSGTNNIRSFSFDLFSGRYHSDIIGKFEKGLLKINLRKNEKPSHGDFKVPENTTVPSVIPYILRARGTKPQSFSLDVFEPFLFISVRLDIEIIGPEETTVSGKRRTLHHGVIKMKGVQSDFWLDDSGWIVKEEGLLGLSLVEEDKADALLLPVVSKFGADLIKEYSISVDRKIENPRDVRYMKVRLDSVLAANIDVRTHRQILTSTRPIEIEVFSEDIRSSEERIKDIGTVLEDTVLTSISDYIRSSDYRIIRQAKSISGAETDTLTIARKIGRWVYENIKKEPTVSIPSAVDILRIREGDCNEHTTLFVALTRALKIPSEVNTGVVYLNGAFSYHSWPSVFVDGTWYDLDPTFGQDEVDATHITLIRGDFEKLFELLRIIGKLDIRVLDVKYSFNKGS